MATSGNFEEQRWEYMKAEPKEDILLAFIEIIDVYFSNINNFLEKDDRDGMETHLIWAGIKEEEVRIQKMLNFFNEGNQISKEGLWAVAKYVINNMRKASLADASNLLCAVCRKPSSGLHYRAQTCEGCKSIFKRFLGDTSKPYVCIYSGECVRNLETIDSCAKCRIGRRLAMGMSRQHLDTRKVNIELECRIQRKSMYCSAVAAFTWSCAWIDGYFASSGKSSARRKSLHMAGSSEFSILGLNRLVDFAFNMAAFNVLKSEEQDEVILRNAFVFMVLRMAMRYFYMDEEEFLNFTQQSHELDMKMLLGNNYTKLVALMELFKIIKPDLKEKAIILALCLFRKDVEEEQDGNGQHLKPNQVFGELCIGIFNDNFAEKEVNEQIDHFIKLLDEIHL